MAYELFQRIPNVAMTEWWPRHLSSLAALLASLLELAHAARPSRHLL